MSTNTHRVRPSASGGRERRLVHPAAALALCLSGCNAPTVTGPGDAAVDLAAPGPDLGGFLDFPATPQIDPSLPGDIADQFQRPAAGALAAPCLSEPTIGALYPRNFSPPLFEWTAAAQANVFELRLRIGNQAHELVIYTPDNRYQMPIDLWQRLSTHSAGQAITISLRAAVLTTGKLSAGPAAAPGGDVTLSRVEASGAVLYWTTSNGSALKGFRVGDPQSQVVIDPPRLADGTKCVGCHVSAPDGLLSFFSRSADANGDLPFSIDARGVDGTASRAPAARMSDVARGLLQRNNQTLPVLSRAHYSDSDAVVVSMLNHASTNDRWELVFTDLRAQTPDSATGVIARTGDGRQPANPAFSQDGKTLAYVSTDGRVTDGRVRDGVADIYTVPWNDRKGGAATPLTGAADPLFNEYYPSYSPGDRLVAFNRVAAGVRMYHAPTAEVFVVPAQGGRAVRVAANDPPVCTGQPSPGVTNSWPRWAPVVGDDQGKSVFWLVFSSTRRSSYPQLYMAAVVAYKDQVRGEVIETYPAVYVTSQNPLESNHTPAWDDFKIILQ